MKQTLHLSMHHSGRMIPRNLDTEDAMIVLVALVAARQEIAAMVEAPLKERVEGLVDRAAVLLAELQATTKSQEQPPLVTNPAPVASEALLALADAETLGDKRALNALIDNHIGTFAKVIEAIANKRTVTERVRAARALFEHIFPDGRKFLNEPNKRQWLAVHQRFTGLTQATWEAIDLLGVREEVESIALLNAHFGALLGITQTATPATAATATTLKDLLARFQAQITEYLGLANALWPSPDQDDSRAAFLKPYLSAEIARAEEASVKYNQSRTTPPPTAPSASN